MAILIGGAAGSNWCGGIRGPLNKHDGPRPANDLTRLPGDRIGEGRVTFFYEHQTVFNAETFSTDPTVPAIRSFVMVPDESGVALETPTANETFEFDGRAGYSVITLSIDSAGMYTVRGGYPGGPVGSIFIFVLVKSVSGPMIVAALSIIGGLGGGIILLVGTYFMRRPDGPKINPDGGV